MVTCNNNEWKCREEQKFIYFVIYTNFRFALILVFSVLIFILVCVFSVFYVLFWLVYTVCTIYLSYFI